MKINQKFAKKAMIVASLTAGVIGFNSMFSGAQSSTPPPTKYCGPLCSNASHTTYCCKDSGPTDCSAGARCSSCSG